MRNVKQYINLHIYILTIISVVIMILLSSCGDNVIRITTDDSEEDKMLRPDDERVIRGDVSYKEAIRCLYMKHRSSYQFDDTFRFYDNGHYYKAFYSVYEHTGRCGHSSCGIVHDPDCPCHKSD